MLKRMVSLAILIISINFFGFSYTGAAGGGAVVTKSPEISTNTKTASAPREKPVNKNEPEEDKYPAVYANCTKTAEADETKYDQLFEECMEKNGFPQTEFSTGGMPIDSGEDD